MSRLPPSLWLLRFFLPRDQREEIVGDLVETAASSNWGPVRRSAWRWWQLLSFVLRYLPERLRGSHSDGRVWRPLGSAQPKVMSQMERLSNDVRLAIRGLRRDPIFTILVVATLALAIAGTTAVFSVVNGVLLRPLPFDDPDRIMVVWQNDRLTGTEREAASVPDYYDYLADSRAFESLAAFRAIPVNFVSREADPVRLQAMLVNQYWDEALGPEIVAGRMFTAEEDQEGGPRVALISEQLWRGQFGASQEVLGSLIELNEEPYTVVGVFAAEASLPGQESDLWLPLQIGPTSSPRSAHNIMVLGRLAPGVSVAESQAEMAAIMARLEEEYGSNANRGAFVEPLSEVSRGRIRAGLLALFGAVLGVLLIAGANVANIYLARTTRRMSEYAIRTALGAGSGRLISIFMTESAVVAGLAWLVGGLAGYALFESMMGLAPTELSVLSTVSYDAEALAWALVLSMALTLTLGLLPLRQTRKSDIQRELGVGRRTGTSHDRMRLQRLLVVSQMGLALMLLAGSALMINSLVRLQRVDTGFDSSNILMGSYRLPSARYPRDFSNYPEWDQVLNFNNQLLDRLSNTPGIRSAALAISHPLDVGFTNSFRIIGREEESAQFPEMATRLVSSGYFEVTGVPLVRGRLFERHEGIESPLVMLINEAAADRFFPDGSAIGSRLRFWGIEREIVGIVGNERFAGLAEDMRPAMYASMHQAPQTGAATVLLKTEGDPNGYLSRLQDHVWSLDNQIAVYDVRTLATTVKDSVSRERFLTSIMTWFAALALSLALVGVYGVLSYLVARRAHEVGVRMAIGATEGRIVAMVLKQGLVLTAVGIAVGLAGSLVLSKFLASLLFGVSPMDPASYSAVVLLLTVASLGATALPALRASRVDPVTAIRSD